MDSRGLEKTHAVVNITYARKNGELPDPVVFDSTDASVREWVTEAIRHGSILGMEPDPNVDLTDYIIERFGPLDEVRDYNSIHVRPKVVFGV